VRIPGPRVDLFLRPEPPFIIYHHFPYFAVSILERVVPLITEAVVEATAAGGGERRGFLARELVPLLASATNILHRPDLKRKF
jgi:hypothetical protein